MIPPAGTTDRPVPLSVWPPSRRGLAAAAVACAVATSVAGALLGGEPWTNIAAFAHVVAAVWALGDPRMLAAQVGAGVAMAWGLLPGTDGTITPVVVVVVGTVATGELLGAAGRLGMVVPRDPEPELRRVGVAVAVALVTSGATVIVGAVAGPAGLVATAVAALGCVVLAVAVRSPRAGADDAPSGQR